MLCVSRAPLTHRLFDLLPSKRCFRTLQTGASGEEQLSPQCCLPTKLYTNSPPTSLLLFTHKHPSSMSGGLNSVTCVHIISICIYNLYNYIIIQTYPYITSIGVTCSLPFNLYIICRPYLQIYVNPTCAATCTSI